ncbi:helix-turn-helix domain-containing protein [Psychroserpens ponticola]|uniref:Helix-turn-helix domain-containing protein n=1 Tax=Psychroserpens ponticola TaxID=2932268 RepID=A0ABY7RV71_9FLAO|nr:helix-turn-helix domain-containing protein [Psychroserpens ponticola]WCO00662.1 helix-turn-helix domain-containing protein [Psychroserpens ponticola]
MTLNYFDHSPVSNIIEEYYELKFSKNSTPFESIVLPIGNTHITSVLYGQQKAIINKTETPLKDIIISGQFFRSYQFSATKATHSLGISFHPTALFKILNTDISQLYNKHVQLSQYNKDLYLLLKPIFGSPQPSETIVKNLNELFQNINLNVNKKTNEIDQAIDIIKSKEGLLNIQEILDQIKISQKTLENHFKTIVGLTPGKYTRLYRFLKLMRKYESEEIDLNDLIHMYDYYDRSHFTKDFKLFMHQSPKAYFNTNNPLLNEYLNK